METPSEKKSQPMEGKTFNPQTLAEAQATFAVLLQVVDDARDAEAKLRKEVQSLEQQLRYEQDEREEEARVADCWEARFRAEVVRVRELVGTIVKLQREMQEAQEVAHAP